MRRLMSSTAVKAPKLLLTPSMTICGLAWLSSQGRSAMDFCCGEITALEVARRRGAPAIRGEKRPFHNPRAAHAPFPEELSIQVDISPDGAAHREIRCIDHSKRDVALASRRPSRGGDAPDLALAGLLGIEQRIVRGLVAVDIEPHQPPARTRGTLGEQRTPAIEVTFVEVDDPLEAELERRALAADTRRLLGRQEVHLRG